MMALSKEAVSVDVARRNLHRYLYLYMLVSVALFAVSFLRTYLDKSDMFYGSFSMLLSKLHLRLRFVYLCYILYLRFSIST